MTIKEIAMQTGVSIGTVDRVIHDRGRVATDTKKKILDIIYQSNYKPDPIAKHLKRNKQYRIFALIPKRCSESGYWALINDGIEQVLEELATFSFHVEVMEFDRTDIHSYQNCFKKVKKYKPDGLLIAPVLQKQTVNLVKDINIPYVFIDTEFPEANPLVTVSQNPFRSGVAAGRVMEMLITQKGKLVVICPYKDIYNLSEREKGFRAYFENKEYDLCTYYLENGVKKKEFQKQIQEIINNHNDMRGIFCVNSQTHIIGRQLVSMDKKAQCCLIGYDLVEENEYGLEDGSIDCIISQSPQLQAYLGCYNLYRAIVLNVQEIEPRDIPIDIVFKENLVKSKKKKILLQ